MPKKMVSGSGDADGGLAVAVLPTWQAAGLSLAVIVGDVFNGSGVLVFGLFSIGVVWALHRLHSQAPESRSTADLIGSVLGATAARVVTVIQFTAYALLGAYAAKGIVATGLPWLNVSATLVAEWLGPAMAVAAVAVAAVMVGALPTRLLAPVVTVLAAFGLLVFFYISLAVIASVASGAAPIKPSMGQGATATSYAWGPVAIVIALAITLVGFEIPTTVSDRLRTVRRPLGWAMALVAGCAATAWVAANMGAAGDFRYDSADLIEITVEMLGEAGSLSFLIATVAQATAALLVLIWGATRVVRIAVGGDVSALVTAAVVTAVLVLPMSAGWGDASAKLWGVASILLLVVYVLAAQANSHLDDSNTVAWAMFALAGVVLAVVVFVHGASKEWWSVGIAAAIVGLAAAWAVKSDRFSPRNRQA